MRGHFRQNGGERNSEFSEKNKKDMNNEPLANVIIEGKSDPILGPEGEAAT